MRKRIIISICALLLIGAFVGFYLYIVIGSPFAHKVWLKSVYTGTTIEFKVNGYYFDRGSAEMGKACYTSKKSEEKIIKEIGNNGANFFNVAGYRFFTLNGNDGVYRVRISPKEHSDGNKLVCIDDMNFCLTEGFDGMSIWMPFPYFVIDDNPFSELYLFRDYKVDTQIFMKVVDELNVWQITREAENDYSLRYKDKQVFFHMLDNVIRFHSIVGFTKEL